jgi:hypothetical protein
MCTQCKESMKQRSWSLIPTDVCFWNEGNDIGFATVVIVFEHHLYADCMALLMMQGVHIGYTQAVPRVYDRPWASVGWSGYRSQLIANIHDVCWTLYYMLFEVSLQ